MRRLTFYIYANIRDEKARVLKTRYKAEPNEHVIELNLDVPDASPMSTVTLQVPTAVTMGSDVKAIPNPINEALLLGRIAPEGRLEKDGTVRFEFTKDGMKWLFSLAQEEGVDAWRIREQYGLTAVYWPNWFYELPKEARQAIENGIWPEGEES